MHVPVKSQIRRSFLPLVERATTSSPSPVPLPGYSLLYTEFSCGCISQRLGLCLQQGSKRRFIWTIGIARSNTHLAMHGSQKECQRGQMSLVAKSISTASDSKEDSLS